MTETETNVMATETEEVLTAEEVAALLKVRPEWVYAAARQGRLPSVKVGRYVRFRRSDIDQWIKAGGQA